MPGTQAFASYPVIG